MRKDLIALSTVFSIAQLSNVAYAQEASAGRVLIVGQIPDVNFVAGSPSTFNVSYSTVPLFFPTSSEETCVVYARSMTPGISIEESYNTGGVIYPQGQWASVGGAFTVGGTGVKYRFPVIYDGVAPAGTRGTIEMTTDGGSCESVTGTQPLIASFNVYIEASPQATWLQVTGTALNVSGNRLTLDHPYLNGTTSAKLFISPVYNPGGGSSGTFSNHPVSVRYDSVASRWTIQNDDGAAMSIGSSFSVRIDGSASTLMGPIPCGFAGGRAGGVCMNSFYIDTLITNRNPNATIFVTPVDGSTNPHPVSVRYDPIAEKWYIVNSDGSLFVPDQIFNVKAFAYSGYILGNYLGTNVDPHGAFSSQEDLTWNMTNGVGVDVNGNAPRTSGSGRTSLFWWQSGNTKAAVILTANQNPQNRSTIVANPYYVGVRFTGGAAPECRIVHQDPTVNMPVNASFNVWGPPQIGF